MTLRTRLTIPFFMLTLACGGGAAEEEPPADDTTAGGDDMTETATTDGVADIAWADMTPEQKGQFMAEVVVPTMRPMFQELDGERFADFGCATCHGEDAREVSFEMPNGVAPLDPAQIPGMFESDQPMAQFMTQRVWPRMGELLGEELYDEETHSGFSCLNCHATADDDDV